MKVWLNERERKERKREKNCKIHSREGLSDARSSAGNVESNLWENNDKVIIGERERSLAADFYRRRVLDRLELPSSNDAPPSLIARSQKA